MILPNNPNKDSNLVNLIMDGAELSLDAILDAGVIKDIPVFGSIAKGYDAIKNMKDYLLQRKIISFLEAAKTDRFVLDSEFVSKIGQDQEYANKVGANLLLLIDQLDEVTKPMVLGTAFSWLCQNKLTYEQFCRIGSGLRYCLVNDLELLGDWARDGKEAKVHQWGLASQSLVAAGFLFMLPQGVLGGNGFEISMSDLGIQLGEIVNACQNR